MNIHNISRIGYFNKLLDKFRIEILILNISKWGKQITFTSFKVRTHEDYTITRHHPEQYFKFSHTGGEKLKKTNYRYLYLPKIIYSNQLFLSKIYLIQHREGQVNKTNYFSFFCPTDSAGIFDFLTQVEEKDKNWITFSFIRLFSITFTL